ncbi:MAG: acyl-CoA synthetase [Gemmatimonadota bacterium]
MAASEPSDAPEASLELIARAGRHGGRIALVDAAGEHAYEEILGASEAVAYQLLERAGEPDLRESPVAFLAAPGLEYVAAQWGIWRAGGIAVPLCTFHPPPELAYVLKDTGARFALAGSGFGATLKDVASAAGADLLSLDFLERNSKERAAEGLAREGREEHDGTHRDLPPIDPERRALILYTSGTTSRPKGVVHTHRSLQAQVESLVEAWEWSSEDRILHVLPLHHTHGIVNALLCALWSGATCELRPAFDAEAVWRRLVEGAEGKRPAVTLFMAVPTIYAKLIAAWEAASQEERERRSRAGASLRLMVSGSAALPVGVFEKWRGITGQPLLERYGMTEIGMALSNPLKGERRPGTVGQPLPGVELRLVDDSGDPLELRAEAASGEIEVRGPAVFQEYWKRPEETREAFREGWFRTGDVAALERGYYRILGRGSVDILKTGGYKVSALEIEEVLREHPGVADCAVVGLPDPEWGERVAAAVVPAEGPGTADLVATLDEWARERLASYKVPRRWRLVDELPRNAMGKVTKPEVRALFD